MKETSQAQDYYLRSRGQSSVVKEG